MKKIYAIFMLAILGFCFIGCDAQKDDDKKNPEKPVIAIDKTTLTLEVDETYTFNVDIDILLVTSNRSVVTVDEATKTITAVGEGEATVTIYALSDTSVFKTVSVIVEAGEPEGPVVPETIEIVCNQTKIYLDDTLELSFKVTPENASQDIIWTTGHKTVIDLSEDGVITPLRSGTAKIKVSSALKKEINATIEIEIENCINPDRFFSSINFENPVNETIKVFGYGLDDPTHKSASYQYNLLGSVTKYLFDDITITKDYTPLATITTKTDENGEEYEDYSNGRSGEKIHGYRYVVVHDTAETSAFGNAINLGNWVESQSSSWHFAVDDENIIQKIPMNEVSWHAGDGAVAGDAYFIDTKIKATSNERAKVTISSDGFFVLNGTKSTIRVPRKTKDGELISGAAGIPTNENIPYTGIENYVDPTTGTYWIGNTWWSETYEHVGNYGGSTHSIGIESSVVKGDNIWLVWNRFAKLIGTVILPETGMTPDNLRQHNSFSGKDCPMTMRHARQWENFVEMVKVEYFMYKYFKDYKVELVCNSPYVSEAGLITKLPTSNTTINYSIKVTKGSELNKTYNFSFTLSSTPTNNVHNDAPKYKA